jgi:hypothetical protein
LIGWRGWIVLLAACFCAAGAAAAQAPPRFGVRVGDAADGWRPVVTVEGLLEEDRALQSALESGLPLRFRLRVELWRKGFFDRLVGAEEIALVLVRDPLDGSLHLSSERGERVLASLPEAQRALQGALRPGLRPRGGGRLYYLADLEVETLSLSDLEELQRWLRGEVQPAVQGRAPAGRAVERGLRRVLVRVIGLPTRRYEGRSDTFVLR